MDNREYKKVRKAALAQGWTVRDTKKGEIFFSPDGKSIAPWHRAHASSNPHALDSFIRRLEAGGFDKSAGGKS